MTSLAADTKRAARGWLPADLTRGDAVTLAAGALVVVGLAFRAWIVVGSWFYGDDLEWLATVARGGADLGWMFSAHDSQLMPLGLALAKVTGSAGAYAWPAAAAQILVLQAAASVACWRMLTVLFGRRPEILVLLSAYLFSVLTVPAVTWWAVALNQLPLHVALFAAVTTHVQYLRTGRRRYVAWTGLWLVVGYLAYVKTLLVVLVLVLIAVLSFASGGPWHRVRDSLRRFWPAWVTYGALTAAYLYVYVVHVPSPLSSDGDVDYLAVADTLVRTSLGPGLVGGPWRWDDRNAPVLTANAPEILILMSWLVVVAGGVYLLVTRRRAWRVLLIVVPYLAVTVYLVSAGRAYLLGAAAGTEFRYLADFGALLPLVLGLAWLPVRGAVETVERRGLPPVPRRGALLVGGVAVFVVSAAVSTFPYAAAWHDDYTTRAFIGNARASLDDALSPPVLADEPVAPDELGSMLFFPYNQPSYFLAPVDDQFTSATAGNDLSTLSPAGKIRDAGVTAGIEATMSPDAPCGRVVSAQTRLPLASATLDYQFWMRIGYLSGTSSTLSVDAGDNHAEVDLRSGLHSLLVRTDGVYDSVTLTPGTGATLCVDRITVGTLEALR